MTPTYKQPSDGPKPLLDFSGTEPWFRPRQFWKYWAFYYPVSWHGWFVSLACMLGLGIIFLSIAATGVSWRLVVLRFLPFLIIILIFYNQTTLKRGEWPSWWTRRRR